MAGMAAAVQPTYRPVVSPTRHLRRDQRSKLSGAVHADIHVLPAMPAILPVYSKAWLKLDNGTSPLRKAAGRSGDCTWGLPAC